MLIQKDLKNFYELLEDLKEEECDFIIDEDCKVDKKTIQSNHKFITVILTEFTTTILSKKNKIIVSKYCYNQQEEQAHYLTDRFVSKFNEYFDENKRQEYKEEFYSMQFLMDHGLLAEINRQILHPLGLALGVYIDSETGQVTRTFLKGTSDPEGYYFSNETLEKNKYKYKELKIYKKAVADYRKKKFGESIQTKGW